MKRSWIRLPSPAMGVALIALVVAMGGSSYAALRIGTKQIKDNAITSPKIRNGAVKNIDLARNSVVTAKIVAGAVTGLQIRDASVGNADLGNDSVSGGKVRGGAIGNSDLATDAVTTTKLRAGAVGNADLADNAVGSSKVADGSLTAADIKDGDVVEGNARILSAAVTLPDGAGQTAILSAPGIGALRASCTAGVATTQWFNTTTVSVNVVNEVVLPGAATTSVSQGTVVAGGAENQSPANIAPGLETVAWQASIDDTGGDHVATVWVSASASGANCRLTAHGIATA
jgi:trimeric autotransporter adhesin